MLSITDPANTEMRLRSARLIRRSRTPTAFLTLSPRVHGSRANEADLVAAGEKVISCSIELDQYEYEERSGTSMAAPHVFGAIAEFLSAHMEYRGDPYKVKEIFLKTATDLGRAPNFQGAGIVDLMRASCQSDQAHKGNLMLKNTRDPELALWQSAMDEVVAKKSSGASTQDISSGRRIVARPDTTQDLVAAAALDVEGAEKGTRLPCRRPRNPPPKISDP